ncbi:MAG: hypothetical protein JNL01_08975 [Bdellovibrionales bacterium]|nr:hypothetical protein [Bdellovibrionales bacterium]
MQFPRFLILSISVLGFFASTANAQLFPNLVGETLGTLPKSRWMVSVAQVNGAMESRFTADGTNQSFSSLFNRQVSWEQVISDRPERKEQVAGLLMANGVDPSSQAGAVNGEFVGRMTSTVPVLGYGVNDRLGIFLALPVLKFEVRSGAGFLSSQSTQKLIQNLEASGQFSTAREFSANFQSSFSKQLARAGYTMDSSYTQTFLGDLRAEIPYVVRGTSRSVELTWTQTVVAPTAQQAPVSELFGFFGGQGRWMLGSRAIAGYTPPSVRRLGFVGSLGGLVPFATHRAMRVGPVGTTDLISDVDPNTRVSGGLQYQAYLSTHYQLNRTFKARVSYQFQEILDRTYSGTLFSAPRYEEMSRGSGERLQSFQAALEINTIQAFLSGDFVMPGMLNLAAAFPVSGKNSLSSTAWMIQGAMFF